MVYLRDEEDKRKNRTIAKSEEKEKLDCESKTDQIQTRSKSKA